MNPKPLKLPPIDSRVAEAPPREKLCQKFGVYPLSEKQKKRKVKQVYKESFDLIKNGIAAVAWATHVESGWESGYEAGPFYKVEYAFETSDGKIKKGSCGGSFDGLHIGYGGGNEWTDFLDKVCKERINTFTILYNGNGSIPVAYLFS